MQAASSGGDREAWASWANAYRSAIVTDAVRPSVRPMGPHFDPSDATWKTPDGQVAFVPCQYLWGLGTVAPETRWCVFATAALCGAALACFVLPSLVRTLRRRPPPTDEGLFAENETPAGSLLGRSVWLDNARFLLIVTIILGHAISIPTMNMPEHSFYLQPILVLTSFFHMVSFSFISGVLSKPQLTKKRMGRVLTHLIVPYIVSKVVWWLVALHGDPSAPMINLFDTYTTGGLEWYIASLVAWRLVIELLSPLRSQVLMLLALALGLVSGYWTNNRELFAVQRTLSFFPFFVAGYLFDAKGAELSLRASRWIQIFARMALFTALAFGLRHQDVLSQFDLGTLGDLNFDYFSVRVEGAGWHWQPREPCGLDYHLSWTHRFVRYAVHFGAAALFLAAVPTDKCFFTEAGGQTMYPYLLHPWVTSFSLTPMLQRFPGFGLYIMTPGPWPGGWVWMVLGASALPQALLLSSAPVRWFFSIIIEPEWLGHWLFTPEPQPCKSEQSLADVAHGDDQVTATSEDKRLKNDSMAASFPDYRTLARPVGVDFVGQGGVNEVHV